jgi:MFS family permease
MSTPREHISPPETNPSQARIAGLETDLKLSSSQYEWLLTSFYITYIIFEWMALLYRIIPAHIYISLCVATWGILSSAQATVTSFGALLALRALLGIGEAAFGPGVPFFLSFFYRRDELALRTGIFIAAAPLANTFASALAYAIIKLGAHSAVAPWRLLFLVEGFPALIVAVIAWKVVPDSPETARFLTRRQRAVARVRLEVELDCQRQSRRQRQDDSRGLSWREIVRTCFDPKCYLTAVCPLSLSNVDLLHVLTHDYS